MRSIASVALFKAIIVGRAGQVDAHMRKRRSETANRSIWCIAIRDGDVVVAKCPPPALEQSEDFALIGRGW